MPFTSWSGGMSAIARGPEKMTRKKPMSRGALAPAHGCAPAPAAQDVRRHSDQEHDERAEHERRAEDRPDADVVRLDALGEQDRDDGNERLGRRGADGGEDASGRAPAPAQERPPP